jgi:hypothetical protein
MLHELFTNVISLHEGISVYLAQRSPVEGFPPILAFCVYICGSLASHLWRCPDLCPRPALRDENVLHWSLKVLVELQDAWPMAVRWHKALEMAAAGLSSLNSELVLAKLLNAPFQIPWFVGDSLIYAIYLLTILR